MEGYKREENNSYSWQMSCSPGLFHVNNIVMFEVYFLKLTIILPTCPFSVSLRSYNLLKHNLPQCNLELRILHCLFVKF